MEMDEPAGPRLRDRNAKSSSSPPAACGGGNRLPSPSTLGADFTPTAKLLDTVEVRSPFLVGGWVCVARVCTFSISCLFTCTHLDCSELNSHGAMSFVRHTFLRFQLCEC